MKRILSYWMVVQLIVVSIASFGQTANFNFGQYRLTKSKALKETPLLVKASIGIVSFHGKVGGISFEQVATPEYTLADSSLSLDYNPLMPDGQRLQVFVNGKTKPVSTAIYDWQIPVIAKFADSQTNAIFTLIGNASVRDSVSRIKYHPAFLNTLLGLRMLQADMLFSNSDRGRDFLSKCPTDTLGRDLLAQSEVESDIERSSYVLKYDSLTNELGIRNIHFDSYILTDWGKEVKFGIVDNHLYITGEPYYLFTETTTEYSGQILESINALARLQIDLAEIRSNKAFQDLSALLALNNTSEKIKRQIQGKLNSLTCNNLILQSWLNAQNYEQQYYFSFSEVTRLKNEINSDLPFIKDSIYLNILKLSSRQFITSWQAQSVSKLLYQLSNKYDDQPYASWFRKAYYHLDDYWGAANKINLLVCESKKVETGNELIYNFNPVVNEACILTMRYAAFFRYVKNSNISAWKNFMKEIEAVKGIPMPNNPSAIINQGIVTPNEIKFHRE